MSIKVAVIGAGSIGFTRRLMKDILTVPELQDTEFAFHDINKRNLDMIAQLARRDIEANGVAAKLTTSVDRRRALDGAHYILNTTRIGGLDAFQTDIDIPLKYGVDQCVGDTLCAGGIMYGQRNIPQILAFCKDIREVGATDALFLNYANPMAMNTWAALEYGGVTTLGLCHGVQGGHHQICSVIEGLVNKGKKQGSRGYRKVTKAEVDIIAAGINHQTWYVQVLYDGKDWTDRLLEGFEQHPTYSRTEKVRIDMLRRFGYYTTESNGHVSEYLPWYRKRTNQIKDWIAMDSWIQGETGGYLRVCTEGRNWFTTDFPNWMKQEPPVFSPETRSEEHGSWIIEARETGRTYRGHFNVMNDGAIPNLPDESIVEVPGYIDKNGISIPQVGDLPLGCAAVCNTSISVQKMAVEAAVHGDVDLLKQAMMMDPLVGAVCNPPEIWQMVDEMLVAQSKWLPQYKAAVPRARKRLASEKPLGTRKTAGAARVKTKTTAQMKKDRAAARRNADAADKGGMMRKKRA
ncbi:MAG: alpha-glucosidase/alpha-galactosidase [Gemmatimonadetes bacterium]|jgi:alpha-galactosidase|nr:alpha-glucosidase/alpha-galactosidase [Gemmatimonadota bacterium]MBT5146298.1 alpha-glucosidase/alpha-galactosidase [Gemmatimonadota bacterium]MBT5591221.1 alpha-glucosidase/alpha-galactosidase [Gemmatimonadota bacterium]MBT5962324.1 alpha-glucosidase/alpha-galactosidase [Gemmatimonadota bacterium]MBT6629304.1 alpha-glucosidase/alpha-galactosidase [Gemmatimonadota bacterium]